ncbi:hypothetical protein [Neobacillus mesonae]|uniref:hypothetical protein n=1 Tax=Neobacillus mesonae TaxID=1193713 RepID=UPI002E1A4765|nr:hypothetical protein [Neobacillus mesonae]
MQEITDFYSGVEIFDNGEKDLESQLEIMKSDLIKAQNSLSRLEQFETEKLRLKEDLELKIEEFNMLTENYQNEKQAYLHALEHIQGQVNIYKEKSQKFDTEKGSWSKEIDELKSELSQTKATLVRMEELEGKNAKLEEQLQKKEMEIYRLKKENERALNQQLEKFKQEMKLYDEKITQYEKDREIWEKQMKQMKSQFTALEANLEEKDNFIKQFIKQPPRQTQLPTQPQPSKQSPTPAALENAEQFFQPKPEGAIRVQQKQEPVDLIKRMMTQGHGTAQNIKQKTQGVGSSAMDFFTLRNKTTQPVHPGAFYGNQ